MHKILRTYFDRWKLKHVNEARFREVCEEVSGQDLGWFFGQWLHGVPIFDYKLSRVERTELPGGKWRTVVTIERLGDGMLPVEIGDADTVYARATGQPAIERVEFVSAQKPGRLKLDPRLRTHDWNYLNNYEPRFLQGRGATKVVFDNPTQTVTRRDSLVQAYRPNIWYNDLGGVVVALHSNQNYNGLFDRSTGDLSRGLGGGRESPLGLPSSPWSIRRGSGVRDRRPPSPGWDVEGARGRCSGGIARSSRVRSRPSSTRAPIPTPASTSNGCPPRTSAIWIAGCGMTRGRSNWGPGIRTSPAMGAPPGPPASARRAASSIACPAPA